MQSFYTKKKTSRYCYHRNIWYLVRANTNKTSCEWYSWMCVCVHVPEWDGVWNDLYGFIGSTDLYYAFTFEKNHASNSRVISLWQRLNCIQCFCDTLFCGANDLIMRLQNCFFSIIWLGWLWKNILISLFRPHTHIWIIEFLCSTELIKIFENKKKLL